MQNNISLKLFILCIFAQLQFVCFAQDSSHIRISLLTCSPGEELYSTFGHSAIRITDSSSVFDIVFNYGTFDFDDPNFYTKFVKGKLLYYVSTENFEDFKYMYQSTNRGITEQVLNLNTSEKIELKNALLNNIREENKFYKYDFFLDNCTTRIRDLIVKYKSSHPVFTAVMPADTRFRQAIHEYLDKNNKNWSKLGIDILLGAPTDAVMTTAQTQFLPDNLMKSLDSSNINSDLVLSSQKLYDIDETANTKSVFTPITIFSLLLISILLLSISVNKWVVMFMHGFDGLLFFLTGALGFVLIFMMTGTDHAMCKSNYNLLWALPSNVILSFFVNSNNKWAKRGFLLTGIYLMLVLFSWFFLPQQMNNGLIPIVLLIVYRCFTKGKI